MFAQCFSLTPTPNCWPHVINKRWSNRIPRSDLSEDGSPALLQVGWRARSGSGERWPMRPALCSTLQPNSRQVLAPLAASNFQGEAITGLSRHQRLRFSTTRAARPLGAGFDPRLVVRRALVKVHLRRRPTSQRHVRPVIIVPILEPGKVAMARLPSERNKKLTGALVLDGSDGPLHDRNAAVLADSTVARWLNASAFRPAPESIAIEDRISIADDIPGRRAGARDGSTQKSADLAAIRPCDEDTDVHEAARIVVDYHRHPPAERPALRQRAWQPRSPESTVSIGTAVRSTCQT